jgi:L-threonylcarbamoyladenylate synthase
MTTILKITEDDFDAAIDAIIPILKSGGIIVYPTDTVYGIGCDGTNEEAVKKVLAAKEIPSQRALSVMVGDYGTIEYYCDTGIWEDIIVKHFLPGPYTFILQKANLRIVPASPNEKLGIRIPENLFCQCLCQRFGRPIVSTSANLTGNPAPVIFEEVDKKILDKVDLAIDGGVTKYKGPSLIIDLVEHKMLRMGGQTVDLVKLPEP